VSVAAALAVSLPVAACGFAYATFHPRANIWGEVISRGPRDGNAIALTFDDGPTPGATDRVLDVLRDANVKCTFFVVGLNVEKSPDLLRRIHEEGHLIANHSYHHAHFAITRMTRYWQRELRATDDAIANVLNLRPALFRPPMGMKTWHVNRAARDNHQSLITWTRRAVDGLPTTPAKILARFAHVRAGDILLLHDGVEPHAHHTDRTATIQSLRPLIDSLKERDLRAVRLDELLAVRGYRGNASIQRAKTAAEM
jgi:peptidoglycan/xylan/chitin deacetylase (PgdA/CDA1 family)